MQVEPKRRKRVTKPPEERRAEILDAAISLFREAGFDETTVQEIADASGVGTGTFYLYFPSKEHVLLAVHERFHAGLEARFAEATATLGDLTAAGESLDHRRVIDVIFEALISYNLEQQVLLEVMCRYDPRLPHDAVREMDQQHARFLADSFRLGSEAGLIHCPDPDSAGYLLGAVNIAMAEGLAYGDTAGLDRLVSQAKVLYYAALAPPDEGDPA
jgi:AcrR family transcriptional regulator